MSNNVTNHQLHELLYGLGFASHPSVEPKCVTFEHPKSKTRLLLPSNSQARSADLLSIRTHLIYRGHLDEATFDAFVEAGTLRAS